MWTWGPLHQLCHCSDAFPLHRTTCRGRHNQNCCEQVCQDKQTNTEQLWQTFLADHILYIKKKAPSTAVGTGCNMTACSSRSRAQQQRPHGDSHCSLPLKLLVPLLTSMQAKAGQLQPLLTVFLVSRFPCTQQWQSIPPAPSRAPTSPAVFWASQNGCWKGL